MTSTRLRLAFAGTPEIARRVLESILNRNEHDVALVLTQPDRPAGRGRQLKASEVKACALQHGIPIEQPAGATDLDPDMLSGVDLMLVVAYGILLKSDVLAAPRLGCINIHTSLLPRWRGAAPIQRAIEAGDSISGISIMQMEQGLDTGPILLQQECPIHPDDTAESLHDRLVQLSTDQIHEVLNDIASGTVNHLPQEDANACYASKISKAEAAIDWKQPAITLDRKIRAFNPFPVAYTELKGIPMRIWRAHIKPHQQGDAGTVVKDTKDSIDVITTDGVLSIEQLQLPGKKKMLARDFLNGHPDFFTTP